jgi:hypothetical protein
MPATTATTAQKFAAMPMFGYFVNELGLEPRYALRRARAIFSELAPDVIEKATAAIVAGDARAWAEAVDPAWDGAAQVFADAANPGGDAAAGLAFEHVHMHQHPDGLRHVHVHWHKGATPHEGSDTAVPHRHDHAQGSPAAGAADRYEAGRRVDLGQPQSGVTAPRARPRCAGSGVGRERTHRAGSPVPAEGLQ